MVATYSTMQQLGATAPEFNLPDMRKLETPDIESNVSLQDFASKPLLVMFICNHCPYVIHIAERMASIANHALSNGFGVVAISANDAQLYPQDGPQAMLQFAKHYAFDFPYLYDERQSVAKSFGAACTPDFYVFDAGHALAYRGQFDGSRPGNSVLVSGDKLTAAIDAVHQGNSVDPNQVASIGCNIKWKPGNEPDYF